jgi:hypothetical protein
MRKINNKNQCSIYDFAKNYVKIKYKDGERSFNNTELKELEHIQRMTDNGYELKLIKLRVGSRAIWIKKNLK